LTSPYRAIAATLALLAVPCSCLAQSASPPAVRVAILLDGPSERTQQVRAEFEKQIGEFFADEFEIAFVTFEGDWTVPGVRDAVSRALADPDVRIIVAAGTLASHDAAQRRNLSTPVIASMVVDAELQELPRKDGASGVPNLNYLDERYSVRRTIEQFRGITPFRKLAVPISPAVLEAIPRLHESAAREAEALGGSLVFVPVATSAADALAALPPGADAVYIPPLMHLSRSEFDALVAGINERRLPSFSYLGRDEVERGVMASYAPRDDIVRRARRVASNMQRVLAGEDAGTLEVEFTRAAQLTINMATARAIGFSPSWPVLTEAELIHDDAQAGRRITLVECVREAVRVNLDLMAARREEASGREEVKKARAPLLPEVGASAAGTWTREETAEASAGSQPERLVDGGISFSQSIWSEERRSRFSIEKSLQEGREAGLRATELDISLDAAIAYLNVLRTAAVARIQRSNLQLSLSNLELARVRESVGASGRSDVYRWESQVATNRRSVLDADADVEITRLEMNRTLDRPLEEPFTTEETTVVDPLLLTGEPKLFGYFANPRTFAVFRDFMVTEGWNASPELRQLDASIAAQRRAHTAAKRSYWLPDVGLSGGLNWVFERGGAGSETIAPPPPFPADLFPQPPDFNWSAELGVSLPLFTGLARRANVSQTSIDLQRLELERAALASSIAQRVRASLHVGGASFAGIEQALAAAEAARANLGLVTESYASGAASIITLIDAQNALLVAEQAASNATYDFLSDLMQVERAIGKFYFLQSPEEQRAYFERLDAYYRQIGEAPRP
jgi:outer membrane protein TolC/ABC-type uncharacterized transport system substrate-binding protein